MAIADITDQRLTNLEIKATYTEDLVEQLDKIIAHQQQQIAQLIREVIELRQHTPESILNNQNILRDDQPPHFWEIFNANYLIAINAFI